MLSKHYTNKIIFINIDTVPQYAKFEDMPENKQALFLKRFNKELMEAGTATKDNTIKVNAPEIDRTYKEKAPLHSEWGKIACISFLVMDENYNYHIKAIHHPDEKELLQTFLNTATSIRDWPFKKEESSKSKAVCSYSGFGFTWPFIAHRCLINGMPIPAMFDYSEGKPWEQEHLISLSNIWNYNRSGSYTSLNTLAETFGVEYNDNVEAVGEWYYNKRFDVLKEYSKSRVLTLANCYLRIKGINNNLTEIKTK